MLPTNPGQEAGRRRVFDQRSLWECFHFKGKGTKGNARCQQRDSRKFGEKAASSALWSSEIVKWRHSSLIEKQEGREKVSAMTHWSLWDPLQTNGKALSWVSLGELLQQLFSLWMPEVAQLHVTHFAASISSSHSQELSNTAQSGCQEQLSKPACHSVKHPDKPELTTWSSIGMKRTMER